MFALAWKSGALVGGREPDNAALTWVYFSDKQVRDEADPCSCSAQSYITPLCTLHYCKTILLEFNHYSVRVQSAATTIIEETCEETALMEGNKRWLLYGDEVGIEDIEESSSQEFYEELPCQEASPRLYFDLMSLVKCVFCGEEPKNAVESPCCGEICCWECLVVHWPPQCSICDGELSPDIYRPAKAVRRILAEYKTTIAKEQNAENEEEWDDDSGDEEEETGQKAPQEGPCPHCGTNMLCEQIENHIEECSEVEVPCANGCFTQVKRKELANHLQNECPLTFVVCRYGCEDQVLRCELDEHNLDNMSKHFQLLNEQNQKYEARISKLEAALFSDGEESVEVTLDMLRNIGRTLYKRMAMLPLQHWAIYMSILMCLLLCFPMVAFAMAITYKTVVSSTLLSFPLFATMSVGITTLMFSIYCALF